MARLMGLETEYGLWVEGRGPADLVEESRLLVQAYSDARTARWNYEFEAPRRDMRGFTVGSLARNPQDARLDAQTAQYVSPADEHADRVLVNGARLYNDHGHPEYSTPECVGLLDLVAHDRAGERIVLECARARSSAADAAIRVLKNNTDYHCSPYGTHESYLMRRDVPVDSLIGGLIPFLVTRQLFAGAGKVGAEAGPQQAADPRGVTFQLSQRADFLSVPASVDTQHNRPVFNTRDEPHADPDRHRRLHVIIGDANMMEWATAMKVGTTALVLDLIEAGLQPVIELADPVQAVQAISRDATWRWNVALADGSSASALDIQRAYCAAASGCASSLPERDWTLAEWHRILDDLDAARSRRAGRCIAADRVDWMAKLAMIEHYMTEEHTTWGEPVLQSLDLAYHDIAPDQGLFRALEAEDSVVRLVDDEQIADAIQRPPANTRAFARGHLIRRFPERIAAACWGALTLVHHGKDMVFDMRGLVDGTVHALNRDLETAESFDETIAVLRRYGTGSSAQADVLERSGVQ